MVPSALFFWLMHDFTHKVALLFSVVIFVAVVVVVAVVAKKLRQL